ncbi:MAG: hypothetical protein ACXVWU_00355 [Nocardioides sp.]
MLTDDQIAGMTPEERQALIKRLARPVDELVPSRRWLRRTRELRIALMAGSTLVLVPWIAYLGISLPKRYVAHHWDLTWVGFDVMLLVLMGATAVLAWQRRQVLVLTAFATGVLLICDAWFDVMTASDRDRSVSLMTARAVELPLAVFLIASSFQVLRLTAARLWAIDAGGHAWQIRIPLPSDADRAVRRSRRVAAATPTIPPRG